MPFIPVPNTARVCLQYLQYSQNMCNIMWFERASAPTVSDLIVLGTAVNSWVVGELLPLFTNELGYRGCLVRDMTTVNSPQVDLTLTPPVPGGLAQPGLPTNCAMVVKFLTALAGRSFRGRNYLPGAREISTNGNTIEAAAQAAYIAAFNDLDTYLAGTGWEHVVCSLYSGVDGNGDPIPRASGVTTAIISYAMDAFMDSQRRRLTGRGN